MSAYLYLLHFDSPYWSTPSGECQHYIGYTKKTVDERIVKHRNGNGSKLVGYALRNGDNDFTLAATREYETPAEARAAEARHKKRGHYKEYCPVCCGDRAKMLMRETCKTKTN